MEQPTRSLTVVEGWLSLKLSSESKWRKRWAVLGRDAIVLYKGPKDLIEQDRVDYHNVPPTNLTDVDTVRSFSYAFMMNNAILATATDAERDDWKSAIEDAQTAKRDAGPQSFSLKKEEMLIAYRAMKDSVDAQAEDDEEPTVVCMPNGQVFRRFAYEIPLRKLFRQYPSLKVIKFCDSMFSLNFYEEFIEFLAMHPEVTGVEFENENARTSDDLTRLIRELPPTITHLGFCGVLSLNGLACVINTLQDSTAIISLDACRTIAKGSAGKAFATLNSTFLHSLNLSGTELGDSGAGDLLQMLADNQLVVRLSLSGCKITRNSQESLSRFLLQNKTIQHFDLSANSIGDGAGAVFLALSVSQQSLQSLNMSKCKISHSSVYAMCKMIQFNTVLSMLDVRQNKFTSESGKFIALAIAQNNSLTSLLTTGLGNEELAHIAVRMDMNASAMKKKPAAKGEGQRRRSIQEIVHDIEQTRSIMMDGINIDERRWQEMVNTVWYQRLESSTVDLLKTAQSSAFFVVPSDIVLWCGGSNMNVIRGVENLFLASTSLRHANHDSSVVKEGWLLKRGGKRKNWKKRWFVLSKLLIFYYTDPDRGCNKGTIVLDGTHVEPTTQGVTTASFKIITPNRTFLISCEDRTERDSWVNAIQDVLSRFDVKQVPMESVKSELKHLCESYEQLQVTPDPHTTFVLQWWLPQALEMVAFLYLTQHTAEMARFLDELLRVHAVSTAQAISLLSGAHLHDPSFSRRVIALHKIGCIDSLNVPARMELLRSEAHQFEKDFGGEEKTFNAAECFGAAAEGSFSASMVLRSRPKAEAPSPIVSLFNALTQVGDLCGILWPLLDVMPGYLVTTLLKLSKETRLRSDTNTVSRRLTSPPKPAKLTVSSGDSKAKTSATVPVARVFDYVPKTDDVPHPELAWSPLDSLQEEALLEASIVVNVKGGKLDRFLKLMSLCPILGDCRVGVCRCLLFLNFIRSSWPLAQTGQLDDQQTRHVVRLLGIVFAQLVQLYDCDLPLCDGSVRILWTRSLELCQRCVIHMAWGAAQACCSDDDTFVAEPMECIQRVQIWTMMRLLQLVEERHTSPFDVEK